LCNGYGFAGCGLRVNKPKTHQPISRNLFLAAAKVRNAAYFMKLDFYGKLLSRLSRFFGYWRQFNFSNCLVKANISKSSTKPLMGFSFQYKIGTGFDDFSLNYKSICSNPNGGLQPRWRLSME
jgi:hypothetical protein